MQFLSDLQGLTAFSYQQLAGDLAQGQTTVSSGCETNALYGRLVHWLSQIARGSPQVAWKNGEASSPNSHAKPLLDNIEKTVLATDFSDLDCDLSAWRNLFLSSPSRILLETSGSSGKPKHVWHTVQSLSRGVKLAPKHRKDRWGWAYPPDHLAGIQVLFQALLNGNLLVDLYKSVPAEVNLALERHSITHISCTPTFLRMMLTEQCDHPRLERLTTGGERLDSLLVSRFSRMFPNARLTNIYASTEVGALLVSHDDGFVVPERLEGKVRVKEGELWFHRSLRVDEPSTTAPTDHSSIPVDHVKDDDFWPTGDQVEILDERPLKFRFLSRSHEGFNVAGFRVDPVRLETLARSHPGVADARFYGIPNSITENLVACDLVAAQGAEELKTAEWQAWMRPQVQRHEVPRIVRWVAAIDTTTSGKVKRS